MEENTYVVDTSVVIERLVSKMIKEKKLSGKIIIPKAVLAELEHQSNQGQEIGFLGLEELQNLQELKKQGKIELTFIGDRPNIYQIEHAKSGGEIDALIRDIAYNEGATLISADKVQSESAKALGMQVLYIHHEDQDKKLKIEKYFDLETMSVHLKEDCKPKAKKGKPGEWRLEIIEQKEITQPQIQEIAKEIVERSRIEHNAFIEISRPGSTIVQYKDYRIVIAKPPVSDGWEITAVRPIKVLRLEDYNLPESISERIKVKARGVIIAGTTGSGKSTFAQSLGEYYSEHQFITKTVESPRSLILSKDITQYSKNLASSEEIHDILFLSRPDYIIFDEMRNTPDFELYTDLRLGGSNLIGVLHAATPIDAVQRFISRMDVGMIPSVLDTLLFVDKGSIGKIMTVQMIVKVPSGMMEADLARPVVEVTDYVTKKLEFEIYSYGEETVVVPVTETQTAASDPSKNLAAKHIENEMKKYVDKVKVKVISNTKAEVYVPESMIARVIGKEGKTINQIEKDIGIKIDVKALEEETTASHDYDKEAVKYQTEETKKAIIFKLPPNCGGQTAEIYVAGHFLLAYTVGKKAEIQINKKSKLGQELLKDMRAMNEVEVRV